ncbi:hypothetical protein B0H66DRAFT_212880 [Apodospora peruviana]|uniref:Uncharacterized protein n=1 Tax=Apodospora peruviana TaxID=516989 RepID=A0AAE0IEC0_9PEZI|nr:hypothetical protein B0H66DRAFT_212880 [Apodospora peruviana]
MSSRKNTITLQIPEVKTLHKTPYPAISTLRPELSQAGRTILIAGGSTGIGFAIARAFVKAKAARIILLGRRKAVVEESAARLGVEARASESDTVVIPLVCDVADLEDTVKLWEDTFKNHLGGIVVDVLVLNAATGGEAKPILEGGLSTTWKAYELNVRTLLDFSQRFYKQDGENNQKKYLINVSTAAIHNFETDANAIPAYGLTKNAGTLLMQQIAKDTSPDDMQITSFHPGGIMTEQVRSLRIPEDLYDWDNEDLPGHFAVWLASPEARFAHGRMLAAHWDVDELKGGEVEKRIESQWNYLKIGVIGLES